MLALLVIALVAVAFGAWVPAALIVGFFLAVALSEFVGPVVVRYARGGLIVNWRLGVVLVELITACFLFLGGAGFGVFVGETSLLRFGFVLVGCIWVSGLLVGIVASKSFWEWYEGSVIGWEEDVHEDVDL